MHMNKHHIGKVLLGVGAALFLINIAAGYASQQAGDPSGQTPPSWYPNILATLPSSTPYALIAGGAALMYIA